MYEEQMMAETFNPLSYISTDHAHVDESESYFQALLISDKIQKAQYYNQTWANIPLFQPLYPSNQQILIEKGFKLRKDGHTRLLITWD